MDVPRIMVPTTAEQITISPISSYFDAKLLSPQQNYPDEAPPVLAVLARLLTEVVASNERRAEAASRSGALDSPCSAFHGRRPPLISLERYLERIFKYAACSPACYVIAFMYMEALTQADPTLLTQLSVHRVLVTCVLVAAKWLDDSYFNNAYYAKVGGVSTAEMNALELETLSRLDFRLYVSPEAFEATCARLEASLLEGTQAGAGECAASAVAEHAGAGMGGACSSSALAGAGSGRGVQL